ncbi:MAG: HAD family hydrolase [archaeon]
MLVLFDIDGTLVAKGTGAHERAFVLAIDKIYSVDSEKAFYSLKLHGRVDKEIIVETVGKLGIPESLAKKKVPDCKKLVEGLFPGELKRDFSGQVLPGVREILSKLKKRKVKLGLLSGNFPNVAYGKLKRVGLEKFFSKKLSGLGDSGFSRVEVACKLARKVVRRTRGEKIVLVGDTPKDILAGKAIGAVTVAVATGGATKAELARAKPDFLIRNMWGFRKIIENLI